MIAIINVSFLVFFTVLTLVLYWISVSPAALEKVWGESSYKICTVLRFFTGISMGGSVVCYILYRFFPLPLPIPSEFNFAYIISLAIAVVITIPSILLHLKGVKDAGKETMITDKTHTLYKGIYQYIRHPQAIGEVVIWWTVAFALHSPFLVLYSFVWIPVFVLMCVAEERDLIIRYGESYRTYRKQTGMFIPKIRPLKEA